MRYLKKFNESIDILYYQIDDNDELFDGLYKLIDVKIFNEIKSRLIPTRHNDIFYIKHTNKYKQNQFNNNPFGQIDIDLDDNTSDDYIEILLTDDEWFVVSDYHNNLYYKCDQVEGLLQLLKDKEIIE